MHGLLVLDKPLGLTSRDAVTRMQGLLPRGTKIGHTGTLDPLASGVLVLCLGQATRLTDHVQRREKVYRAGVCLGGRSTTDDAEGTVTWVTAPTAPTESVLRDTLQHFVGEIEQTPPDFSAAKVDGRRAYELARRGKDVDLAARRVNIYDLHVHHYEFPKLDIEVRCGKGTYIRSLARDLGERLGCGAYLESLRRTRVGSFHVEEAVTLEASKDEVRSMILPMHRAIDHLPRWTVDAETEKRFRQGQRLPLPEEHHAIQPEELAVFTMNGLFVGVGDVNQQRRIVSPSLVFAEVQQGQPR